MKTKLMAGASALTLVMIAPGVAMALPSGECGVPNTSASPNVASCISDSTDFQNGISYDQSIYGTAADLKVDLYGTVLVNATTNDTGVSVSGSADHDALITARNGSRINASRTGLEAETFGTGDAVIENHGRVTTGALGATALASGTGMASITNASDGTITVTQPSGSSVPVVAGLAITGQNGNVLNQGIVTVNSLGAAGSVAYGLGGMGLGGGTVTLTNASQVTVTATDGDAIGIGAPPSDGNLAIANNANLTVSSGTGSATGLVAVGTGSVGTTSLTNTGVLSVTSQGGAAVGMSAAQRSDVAMAATRASAGSTFSVSGADATGFEVTDASGAVSVSGTGQYVQVTATGDATGVSVSGGTTQDVSFEPAIVGGIGYSGDVAVNAGGQAAGVLLSGATGGVSVDFTGARLSVSSTGGGATGISVEGGSTVGISVVPGLGSGATLAVSAAGGTAMGIATSGATGAQTVAVGDGFRVTNTAGDAHGIALADGTDQTVSLAYGATVTGSDGATGVRLTDGSGAIALTSSGALSVDGGIGDADGVLLSGGSSHAVTLEDAFTVTSEGDVRGVWSEGAQGSVSIAAQDTFGVTSTGEGRYLTGIYIGSGTDETVALSKGLSVQASGEAAGVVMQGSGALTLTSAEDFAVTATDGAALGGYMIGGTSQSVRFDGDLVVSAANFGDGFVQFNGTGAVSFELAGDFTGTNLQDGVIQSGGQTQSIAIGGDFSLSSPNGYAYGVQQADANESSSLVVDGAFDVAARDYANGVNLSGNDATVSLAQGMTVSAAGDAAEGLTASLNGDADISLGGALTVTNALTATGGEATGIYIEASGAQSIEVAGPVTVSADGQSNAVELYGDSGAVTFAANGAVSATSANGAALGVLAVGGTDQTITFGDTVTVTAAREANAVNLFDGTGTATVRAPAGLTVSSSLTSAGGIWATNGTNLLIEDLGDVSVSGEYNAHAIRSIGMSGDQSVTVGNVSTVSRLGDTVGISLSGAGSIELVGTGVIASETQFGTGVAVSVEGTGSDGAIDVTLADVRASGDRVQGVSLVQTAADGTGTIGAVIAGVTTDGDDAAGVTVQGSQSGAVSLVLGQSAAPALLLAAADETTNGVSTQGDNSNAVDFTVIDGAGTLTNLGTISTTGANSLGIAASATGTGSISIGSVAVTTSGAGSDAISVQTGSGAQTLVLQTVTASGEGSRGVVAVSDSGAITLTSGQVSAVSGDAISLTSTTGNIAATLASAGSTVSGTGAGLVITTGGSADVVLGSNAVLQGGTFGLSSDAEGGQDVVLAGTVRADSNHAVALSGGAATLTNSGTVDGYMTFDTAATTLTNSGTWNAHGGDTTFTGDATLINSGTIKVNAAASAAATMNVTGLTTFRNSGTISLVNGHTGDVLNLGDAAFVGSGNSRVVLEANLGIAAVGASAAQSADQLTVGAASGTTTLSITDLSSTAAARFNFDGIRLVNADSVANGAFVLEGGSINKGFVDYRLMTDGDGNLDLVGVPSAEAFELIRTGAEVRHYWRRSGDAWSEQMRAFAPQDGLSLWGQVLGGSETNRSRPIYSETVLGTATSFAPNLDMRDSWWGGQFGLDWGKGSDGTGWGLGVTGGYVSQEGKVKASGDRIKIDGGNVGLYARYRSADGFFAHALAKLDRYSIKYDFGNGAAAPKTNGTSYGVEVEAGYHIRSGAVFFEPSASASWSDADLDGFSGAQSGVGARFDHVQSFYGRAGLRAGVETKAGGWTLQPYVGANWEGEMNGRPEATLSSGGENLLFRDASEGGRARFEAGIQGSSQGLSAFAKVDGVTGSGTSGIAARAGVSVRW
ncbi:MAG: hypothetical protein E2586_14815 [Novosphingobium sp.]|uniref:hypothetical protein n=1 Tax=Novosphingobium sp. TaxID=1874826 RepID=UPI0012CB4E64|nr:hypothetical protein [Novosphingobium sp.]MPS69755.1 hypothetical protein [Novosphingobium sp.]